MPLQIVSIGRFANSYAEIPMTDKKEPAGNSALGGHGNPLAGCPLTAAQAAIGGKWKMIIIYWLAEGPAHFAGLRRKMPAISSKVLTQQLRQLGAEAIVDRRPAARVSAPVVYSLTPHGRALLPIIESVRLWGHAHLKRDHVQ